MPGAGSLPGRSKTNRVIGSSGHPAEFRPRSPDHPITRSPDPSGTPCGDGSNRMSTRTALTIVFATVAAVAGFVFVRSLVPPESPSGSLQFLSAAPALPIFDRQGRKVDLAKEKGRITVIHFWATWCPPCVDEIPE